MVVRDAMAHGFLLRTINNAIKAFQFLGPDKQNPPNTMHQMRKGNYIPSLRKSRSMGKYKRGLAVVYGINEQTHMSTSATIILRAACDSVTHLDGQSVAYNAAENVRARDLVHFVTDSYALHSDYMFQIKWKSSDVNGKPKISTLVPMSPVTDGETYYFIISTLDECEVEINPSQMVSQSSITPMSSQSSNTPMSSQSSNTPMSSQSSNTPMSSQSSNTPMSSQSFITPMAPQSSFTPMAPQSPMTPHTLHQYQRIFSSTSTNLSPMPFNTSVPEVRVFPGSQSSDHINPSCTTPRRIQSRIPRITRTTESSINTEVSAVDEFQNTSSLAEGQEDDIVNPTRAESGENDTAIGNNENDACASGSQSTENPPMENGILQCPVNHIVGVNRGKFLGTIYSKNQNIMDTTFAAMTTTPFIFYDINVNERMRSPKTIAAFVLICPTGLADYDIRVGQIARDVCQNNPITREIVRPLIKHLNEITHGNFFDYLITPDGPLAARCLWISKMVTEDKSRIPELVVAKFPMFKTNGSWLQHDFAYTLENIYKFPMFNISSTLEKFAPAIAALACDHKILSADDQVHASTDLLRTTDLLLQLLGIYLKKKDFASIDRLVASSQGLPSVDEMIDRRRAIKQIAPMIFVIQNAHGTDYFVSTDDFALKVPGTFGDALHYLTALHYVLYIEYAKELLHFNVFLENLCGINMKKMPKSRLNLKMDLDTKMKHISHEPQ
uniref:Uncharacterized protein n=1 Tax=Panagrolaimus davidi TaxID=227884 RepID=A0A914Q1Y8_9BILA